MKVTMSLLIAVTCLVLTVFAHGQVGKYSKGAWQSMQSGESQRKVDSDIIAEGSESSNPKEREARRAKNTRYNTGGADLTVERSQGSEIFFEHVWPAVDFIPAAESALVVIGRVIKVQPYLASDRSRIYTEITIAVDDLLKQDQDNRVSATKTAVIDRLGGALKLKTGRIVRDEVQIDNLGDLQLGRRYVVFARAINDGNDISLIKSYELVDGKVFTNDSRPGRLLSTLAGVPSTWADEAAFLKAVREVTVSTARNAKHMRKSN
jgi:hypothetical protein